MISITHIVFAIFFVFIVTISVFVRAKLPSFAREKSSLLIIFTLLPFAYSNPKYFILLLVIPFIYKNAFAYTPLLVWIINLYSTLTILLFGYSPSASANIYPIYWIKIRNPIFYALINIVFALISFFLLSSRGVLFLSFLSLSLFFLSRLNFYPIKNIFPANSWLIRLFWALFLSLLVALPTPLLALYSNQNLSPKEQDISLYERSIFAGVSLVSAKVIAMPWSHSNNYQDLVSEYYGYNTQAKGSHSFVGFLLINAGYIPAIIFSLLFGLMASYLSMNVSVPLSLGISLSEPTLLNLSFLIMIFIYSYKTKL